MALDRRTLTTIAAVFAAGEAPAQESLPDGAREKTVRIVQTASPPVIDGVLDEAAWQLAVPIDDLHEIQPTEYAPASERTVVYLLYDKDAIYIGARLYDRNANEIVARILRQGEEVFGDDWFSVLLDPFHDRRSGYRFMTNPNGLRQEGIFQNISEEQWDWEGIWHTASTIDEQGWVTEIAIPFKTLSFNPDNDTWGINFRRAIARRDERTGWVSRNRNSDPSTSGMVVGLAGLEQGLGLDVVPSLSVSERRPFDGTASTTDTDPSLDVFYKLSPSLTAALTINTDFSATEVDDRQVNLTRFGLFFPEKRDFFLQDADIFEFGGLEQNGRPFFSRRIGLSDSGEPIDLEVGGKVTGRIGRWNIGTLSVRQDELETLPADNATVARASANLLEESNIGMIVTEGNPGLDHRQFARRRRLPLPQQPPAGRQARGGQRLGARERQRRRDGRRARLRRSRRHAEQHGLARRIRLHEPRRRVQPRPWIPEQTRRENAIFRHGVHAPAAGRRAAVDLGRLRSRTHRAFERRAAVASRGISVDRARESARRHARSTVRSGAGAARRRLRYLRWHRHSAGALFVREYADLDRDGGPAQSLGRRRLSSRRVL